MGSRRDPIVHLDDVGKRYVKYEDTPLLVTRAIRASNRRSDLWALRHVDLTVEPGEAVGVIGRNGAGKTTMLRILAGISAPTEGMVSVKGRVAPLIAVGVGFHAELSGRENVYVNGTILGMTQSQIDRRFDSIVEFAELADFIDTPVKFYSSGMFVRLGFAVAVAARPDVLLIDEVLAVGDVAFQMKCFDRMRELREQGATMLLVSHNLQAVRNMCDRVMVLRNGEPVFTGDPEDAITAYYDQVGATPEGGEATGSAGPIEITGFDLLDGQDRPTAQAQGGDELTLRMDVRFRDAVESPTFALAIHSGSGVPVYVDSTFMREGRSFAAGDAVSCRVRFPARFTTGAYVVRGFARWSSSQEDQVSTPALNFHVSGPALVGGLVDLAASFEVDGQVSERPAKRTRPRRRPS